MVVPAFRTPTDEEQTCIPTFEVDGAKTAPHKSCSARSLTVVVADVAGQVVLGAPATGSAAETGVAVPITA